VSDKIIGILLVASFFYLAYVFGYEMSERKHCIEQQGSYSLDFGVCISGEVK